MKTQNGTTRFARVTLTVDPTSRVIALGPGLSVPDEYASRVIQGVRDAFERSGVTCGASVLNIEYLVVDVSPDALYCAGYGAATLATGGPEMEFHFDGQSWTPVPT